MVGAILEPETFPTWDNVRNMLTQASVVGVLAIGMTFVIATAGIDLSVGSMVAAAGVFGGIMVGTYGTSSLVFILATIVFATLLGTINATAVAFGRVVPFIATLAMFSIARGIALLLNDKLPVGLLDLNGGSFGTPAAGSLLWFGSGRILGIPPSVYVFLAITILGWIVLNRTRYGRYVVAVGGNREAARIAGVPVRKTIFSVYVLSGLLAGVAAVLLCARLGSASPVSGNLYELDAIGAVVIGGTSLAGGRATIVGHVPRRPHVRPDLQPHDAAQSLDRSAAGDQGADRPRRRAASAPGVAVLIPTAPKRKVTHDRRYAMSRKRLFISVAAAMLLLAALTGCSLGGDDEAATTAATTGSTEDGTATEGGSSGQTVTIIASVPPTDHGWLGAISKNAKAAADAHDDVEFTLLEAADADSQAQQIEQAIAEKPDALVVLPQDGAALTPVARAAEQAGIPVVNIDRLFTTPDAATATILGDNHQIGVLAAEFIAEELDCQGNVVEIQGLAGISVTTDRTKGFTDTLEDGVPGRRHRDRRQPAGRLQPGQGPDGDGEHPPGRE